MTQINLPGSAVLSWQTRSKLTSFLRSSNDTCFWCSARCILRVQTSTVEMDRGIRHPNKEVQECTHHLIHTLQITHTPGKSCNCSPFHPLFWIQWMAKERHFWTLKYFRNYEKLSKNSCRVCNFNCNILYKEDNVFLIQPIQPLQIFLQCSYG